MTYFDNTTQAYQAGVAVNFLVGAALMVLSFFSSAIRQIAPPAALLGTLASVAIVYLAVPAFIHIFDDPIVSFAPLMFIIASYFVKLPIRLPGLSALLVGIMIAWATGSIFPSRFQ